MDKQEKTQVPPRKKPTTETLLQSHLDKATQENSLEASNMDIAEYARMYGLIIAGGNTEDIAVADTDYQNETGYVICDGFGLCYCKNRKELEDFLKRLKEHPRKYIDCDHEESDCWCCSLNNYGYDCHNNPIEVTDDMW